MRLIDADALLRDKEDHDRISTHLIYNAPTIDTVPVVRCKDCKKWKRNDGTFPDFDGKEWHGCKELETFTSKIWNETEPVTPSWFYCGYAEREEE